jgi:hypothetical protein
MGTEGVRPAAASQGASAADSCVVYAHLDPKRARAAAGRIDAALGRQPAAAEVAAV